MILEPIMPDEEEFEHYMQDHGYMLNFDKHDCKPVVYENPDTQYAWGMWVSGYDAAWTKFQHPQQADEETGGSI